MAIDVSSIELWAVWDFSKKPWYTLYKFQNYTGDPHHMYIFKQKDKDKWLGLNMAQILTHVAAGTFRPFIICSPPPSPPPPPNSHFRPFGAIG